MHYWGMNDYKHNQLEENRRSILNILKMLHESQVEQIHKLLLIRSKQEAENLYEMGKINKSEKREYIKENTVSKRTVHRHLEILVEQGLVEHVGYKYCLANKIKDDVRYWSKNFGSYLLNKLTWCYSPMILKFEENIDELIKIFGIYMLYSFIVAAHPSPDYADRKMSKIDMMNNDRLVETWIKEMFEPEIIFGDFIAIMSSLPEDDIVQKILDKWIECDPNPENSDDIIVTDNRGKRISIPRQGNSIRPKIASDICFERWISFIEERGKPSFYDIEKKPFYHLDKEIIDKIMQVLQKKYSPYHEHVMRMIKDYDTNMSEEFKQNKRLYHELDSE